MNATTRPLLTADQKTANRKSVQRARQLLKAYAGTSTARDTRELVTDILSDLLHLCEVERRNLEGYGFSDILDSARDNFHHELNGTD